MYTNDSTWNNVHSTSTCNKMDLLQCQALKSSRNFGCETLNTLLTIFNHTESYSIQLCVLVCEQRKTQYNVEYEPIDKFC